MLDKHWRRTASALTLLLATLGLLVCTPDTGQNISASEAFAAASKDQLTIIDIRTRTEWKQTGVGVGVKPVTMHRRDGIKGFVAEVLKQVGDDPSVPIALICATGNRSNRMQRFLQDQGFTNVLNIPGGMLGGWLSSGWIDQGLPVKPCDGC